MGDELWDFATRVYGAEGVTGACLAAQDDHGIDVIFALAAAWAAQRGVRVDAAELAAWEKDCGRWREAVIKPLRQQRRRWRDDTAAAADYAALKALELAAEREQLSRLAQRLGGRAAVAPLPLLPNLENVFRHFRASPAAAQALAAVFGRALAYSGARKPPD